MNMIPDSAILSSEFQAILTPLQEENQSLKITAQTLKEETQEWKQKYHNLLEQLRLA